MKTNNTTVYTKIQVIESIPKSKKSNVLTGIGFVLFIGGIGLGYFRS
jgi:xanthine/uracil/vitamin C permease (AzgA family)